MTPHVTDGDAERSVEATGMEDEQLFEPHEYEFVMPCCFLLILIIEVFK